MDIENLLNHILFPGVIDGKVLEEEISKCQPFKEEMSPKELGIALFDGETRIREFVNEGTLGELKDEIYHISAEDREYFLKIIKNTLMSLQQSILL